MDIRTITERFKEIRYLFLIPVLSVIVLSSTQLTKEAVKQHQIRKRIPFHFSGTKFEGLEKIFKDIAYVGYYSDRNISTDKKTAAQFAQAQYVLAPTILDPNNVDREYILFDCTNEEIAMRKIKEIGAVALKKNTLGIILAKRLR